MRYFLFFSYDGTVYHGWQIQPNGNSVQAELQKALSTILREDISVVGAGRTDTGVHARKMSAHFDTEKMLDCEQTVYKLNRVLPRDIAALDMRQVADDMHARFSAVARTYHYYFHTRRDPFLRHYSCETYYPLDMDAMQQAAEIIKEYSDFSAFCKSGSDVKTTICKIKESRFVITSDHTFYYEVIADRFLRNMVRAIVGTLVEVGRGRLTLSEFRKVIENGNRSNAGESMPAHALFLEDVEYP